MSKYEDVSSDSNVICPYCGYKYQPEAEDYSADDRAEECGKCGKKYYLRQDFSVTHETSPNCELNGMPHVFEPVKLSDGRTHPFCSVCGFIAGKISKIHL